MPTSPFDRNHFDYSPWFFWDHADDDAKQRQVDLQQQLMAAEPDTRIAERCFISEVAAVQTDRLDLGYSSYIAGHAYVTGTLVTGTNCTINPFTVVRGEITLGDAVRIGAHTSILAFNHTMDDPDTWVFKQPLTSKGIVIGDDVWVGSHVMIVDGVTIGDRAMIAAGSIVTKDVPAGAVVAGNPARVKRWRVAPDAPA
ncbi:MAG TPA: acyltransferase, partial [Candidatus Microbacterium stercoravium]|nr:acyltransferase [Candidatus Microbacterium stercoravium]